MIIEALQLIMFLGAIYVIRELMILEELYLLWFFLLLLYIYMLCCCIVLLTDVYEYALILWNVIIMLY